MISAPVKLRRRYEIIVSREADGRWVSFVPDLNYISTWGDTEVELMERTKEMIEVFQMSLIKMKTYWPLPQIE